jgi:hypothetical protein
LLEQEVRHARPPANRINDPLNTFTEKHGTLVLRVGIEWLDAGNGYSVGVATSKVVRGTCAHKGITGTAAPPTERRAGGSTASFNHRDET